MALTKISVRGAREHNLKGVDIDLPRDSLIVITGLSGSGKSSLAFDTIYAEGQRRYVESLSAYARQFLEMMQKPDVEHIEGLSPAISIEQKTTSKNPRSTVATVTEIYDYMRLLWARVGTPYSPATGLPIEAQTVSNMVDRVMALPEGTRAYLLAPVVRGRKGEYRKEMAEWQKAGFTRVRIDGEIYPIEDAPALDKKFKHDIEVVVDRLAVKEGLETRLADSFETALRLAEGLAYVDLADGVVPGREGEDTGEGNLKGAGVPANRIVFSEKFACPVSGFTIEEIEPRLFSFNAPQGACATCDGIGEKQLFDPQLVVPNEALTLKQGAIMPWAKSNPPSPYYMQVLASLAKEYGFDLTTPWQDLGAENQDVILYGTKGKRVPLTFKDGRKQYTVNKPFEGVIGNLNRRMLQTESAWMREELAKFQTAQACETCNGKRLNPKALSVKIPGPAGPTDIAIPTQMSVADAKAWFLGLDDHLTEQQAQIAKAILKEINERLGFLDNVGLDYLNLDRTSGTLSGGESQRIRLASQIGSGLSGVLYVLDEPSIGLHQRDNDRLLETLKRLRDLGNTVIVVEHDEDAIRAADYVVDLGPGAGRHGGEGKARHARDGSALDGMGDEQVHQSVHRVFALPHQVERMFAPVRVDRDEPLHPPGPVPREVDGGIAHRGRAPDPHGEPTLAAPRSGPSGGERVHLVEGDRDRVTGGDGRYRDPGGFGLAQLAPQLPARRPIGRETARIDPTLARDGEERPTLLAGENGKACAAFVDHRAGQRGWHGRLTIGLCQHLNESRIGRCWSELNGLCVFGRWHGWT